jgi:phage recombination protein Bet
MATATAKKQQDGLRAESQNQRAELGVAPFLGERQRLLLRKGMCKHLTDDQAEYFFEVVERSCLDPFEGQIWPMVRSTKDDQGVRHPTMAVVVKLQGLRAIGDRSNLCDGEDPVEWVGKDGVWKDAWLESEPPVAARAKVYRKDRTRPQVVVCRWDAYAQNVFDRNGSEKPNATWARYGSHMLGKCALAGAYRGAFPRQASGVYLAEELGEGIDPESEIAVEAELKRRYQRDETYWDEQREKGIYPEGGKPEKGKTLVEVFAKEEKEASAVPASPAATLEESEIPDARWDEQPQKTPAPAADWRTFTITRIRPLEGRTVGSLLPNELRGLAPWLEKVSEQWGSIDQDIKMHYTAIAQRIEYESAQAARPVSDDELQQGLRFS